jgi:hypothetical protein
MRADKEKEWAGFLTREHNYAESCLKFRNIHKLIQVFRIQVTLRSRGKTV